MVFEKSGELEAHLNNAGTPATFYLSAFVLQENFQQLKMNKTAQNTMLPQDCSNGVCVKTQHSENGELKNLKNGFSGTCALDSKDSPISVDKEMSKLRIIKNLLVLCVGFLLLFSAYEALANLQSTMNGEKGVGTAAQAVMYAFFNFSTLVLPTFVIRKLGCKKTLILSVLGFCPYVAANFYPSWITLIPAAVLCGTVAGPLWASRSTYVNEISFRFSSYTKSSVQVVTATFFGICCMFYQNTQIWGNLISYYVLRPINETEIMDIRRPNSHVICGASSCPDELTTSFNNTNQNLEPPSLDKRYMLIAIFLCCSIGAAAVMWFFLDYLPRESGSMENPKISPRLLFATFNHLRKVKQILLLPLTFYLGISDGFYVSDFTKAYIACAWGIHRIGFVMIFFGVLSSLTALLSGLMVKYLSRPTVFLSAAVCNLAMYIALLLWKPDPDHPYVFFLFAGAWGYGDAIWWSQIVALYGVLFKNDEEAAFSNFYFWNSLGFLVAYAYNNSLCTHTKIYILLCILTAGILGYILVELMVRKKDKELRNSQVLET